MDQQWQPTVGTVVLIVADGSDDRHTGIVGSVVDGAVEVTLSRALEGVERNGATVSVEASFVAPSAMYRLETKAKVTGAKGARLVLGPVSKIERVQRRRFPRISATLPVAVAAFAPDSRSFVALEGLTIDLSAGGLSLLTTTPLPDQATAHLALTLPGGVVNAIARVVDELRYEDRFQYRMALEHSSDEGLDLLARYVNHEAADASDVLAPQGAEP